MKKTLPVKSGRDALIHIRLFTEDFVLFQKLEAWTEATTASELVRRAIHAYAEEKTDSSQATEATDAPFMPPFHARLPPKTKALLDRLTGTEGVIQAEIIRRGLQVMKRQAERQDQLRAMLANPEAHANEIAHIKRDLAQIGMRLRIRPLGTPANL